MINKTHKRLFILLSIMLFIADTLFVTINYVSDKRTMQQSLSQDGLQLERSFNVAFNMTLNNMSQLATFIARSTEVQHLFSQGVQAVKKEGGGAGGAESARLRDRFVSCTFILGRALPVFSVFISLRGLATIWITFAIWWLMLIVMVILDRALN